jgi:UDP-2,3-diacylglucosamine pyrophosphatase LpxH
MPRPDAATRAELLMLRLLRYCAAAHARAPTTPSDRRPDYRAVFVSDVHVGLGVSQAAALCDFLEHTSTAQLYLVGDIVDLWALERRPRWHASSARLMRVIGRLARRGTHVIFVPGNHDDALRRYIGAEPGIELHRDLIHRDALGRALLVTHGDEADSVVRCHPLLARIGGALYDGAVVLSHAVNWTRRLAGLPYWNVAGSLKRLVKRACTYVGSWEAQLAGRVRREGLDGVICGHIHVPRIGEAGGVAYLNCGDWVEHATALAERWDGSFLLLAPHEAPAAIVAPVPRRPVLADTPPLGEAVAM